jgi:hypothetical protein
MDNRLRVSSGKPGVPVVREGGEWKRIARLSRIYILLGAYRPWIHVVQTSFFLRLLWWLASLNNDLEEIVQGSILHVYWHPVKESKTQGSRTRACSC